MKDTSIRSSGRLPWLQGWRATVVVLPILLIAFAGPVFALDPPHDADPGPSNCSDCHSTHGAGGFFSILNTYVNDLCLSCHDGVTATEVSNHLNPTDTASPWYGRNFDGNGDDLVCTDCHEPHSQVSALGQNFVGFSGSGGTNVLRRTPDGLRVPILYDSTGSRSSYIKDNPNNGICEVCHTVTSTFTKGSDADTHFGQASGQACIACHSHFNESGDGWAPQGGECIQCHDGIPSGGPGYVGRDVMGTTAGTGDFTQASRHVFGGTPDNWDCIVCHREGDEIAASQSTPEVAFVDAIHSNAQVELRDVDDPSADPGWIWDKTAPDDAMHTAMDLFCLGCHDSDLAASSGPGKGGASGIAVKSDDSGITLTPTSAERLKPFNSSDNLEAATDPGADAGSVTPNAVGSAGYDTQAGCEGHVGFTWTTDGRCVKLRTAVLDVKRQFYTSNPSHHAVLGQRYSSFEGYCIDTSITRSRNCTSPNIWIGKGACMTPDAEVDCTGGSLAWNTALGTEAWVDTGLKSGDSLHVVRETATLHCSDCHTVDVNAHGASNSFMLVQNTVDATCYTCHAPNVYSTTADPGSRFPHDRDTHAFDGGEEQQFGSHCLNCHGGADYDGYGGIHGLPSGDDARLLVNPGISQQRYRFIGGGTMSAQDDFTSGDGTISCYFVAPSPQPWSNCTHHGTSLGGDAAAQYPRGVSY